MYHQLETLRSVALCRHIVFRWGYHHLDALDLPEHGERVEVRDEVVFLAGLSFGRPAVVGSILARLATVVRLEVLAHPDGATDLLTACTALEAALRAGEYRPDRWSTLTTYGDVRTALEEGGR